MEQLVAIQARNQLPVAEGASEEAEAGAMQAMATKTSQGTR